MEHLGALVVTMSAGEVVQRTRQSVVRQAADPGEPCLLQDAAAGEIAQGGDRARTWDTLVHTHQVQDRFSDTREQLNDDELQALADLSLVNEVDVAEHSPEFLGRHGDYFRGLTAAWAPLLSPAVLADARRVFG